MAICEDISTRIVKQPDLAEYAGMLLQVRDHIRDGGESRNAESALFEEAFRAHISDVAKAAASHR
jgi:hypothetical protein